VTAAVSSAWLRFARAGSSIGADTHVAILSLYTAG
jgi:hypothetical protein